MIELNKVYKMDNLELLNQLPNNYIDLIYCDILYNTGRKFKDYNDNLGTPQQAIEWYRPRIEGMYRVLKDTGSIYLHMDYRLVHYMKVLMDEIFGFDNFRNEIIWKRDSAGKGAKKNSKQWSREFDNILMYRKTNKAFFNQIYITELKENQLREYIYKEENGRKFKKVTLGDYSEKSIEKMKKENLIYTTKTGRDYKKYYLDEAKFAIGSIWDDIVNLSKGQKEKVNYDTQKPKLLLERIIKSSSNENDIVLDLFCGSGTSMVVAKELGRKFIGCDISEKACEISEKRLMEVEVEGKVCEGVG